MDSHRSLAIAAAGLVLGGFAGAANAQSNVTLFGVVDIAYEYTRAGPLRISRLVQGANAQSRIGFRGREDLGGGLAAQFWLEAGFSPDSGEGLGGAPIAFLRRSTVSLTGPFGEIRLGRDVVPSSANYVLFDVFTGTGAGTGSALLLGAGVFASATVLRSSNSIGYFLPGKLGGFYGNVMYAFSERARPMETTATGGGVHNEQYVGARLGYASGKLDVAAAWGKTRYDVLPTSTAVSGDLSRYNVGASYDFGSFKLMGLVSSQQRKRGVGGARGKDVGVSVGAIVPVGAGQIKLQYAQVNQNAAAGDNDARQIALGYVHNLSKRTAVYGTAARIDNRRQSALYVAYPTGGFPVLRATTPGANVTAFDLGIRHAF